MNYLSVILLLTCYTECCVKCFDRIEPIELFILLYSTSNNTPSHCKYQMFHLLHSLHGYSQCFYPNNNTIKIINK